MLSNKRLGIKATSIVACVLLFCANNAWAQSANAKFTASIAKTCSISGTGIVFGNYYPTSTHLSSPLNGQTTLSVKCTAGISSVITLVQKGAAPSATCDASDNYRALKKTTAAEYLSYKLYADSERTLQWGCVEANRQTMGPFVNSNTALTKVMYGSILPGQYVSPGSYTDSVQFQVIF